MCRRRRRGRRAGAGGATGQTFRPQRPGHPRAWPQRAGNRPPWHGRRSNIKIKKVLTKEVKMRNRKQQLGGCDLSLRRKKEADGRCRGAAATHQWLGLQVTTMRASRMVRKYRALISLRWPPFTSPSTLPAPYDTPLPRPVAAASDSPWRGAPGAPRRQKQARKQRSGHTFGSRPSKSVFAWSSPHRRCGRPSWSS